MPSRTYRLEAVDPVEALRAELRARFGEASLSRQDGRVTAVHVEGELDARQEAELDAVLAAHGLARARDGDG